MAQRQMLMLAHFTLALPGIVAAYVWLAWWAALPIIAGAVIGILSFRKLSRPQPPRRPLLARARVRSPARLPRDADRSSRRAAPRQRVLTRATPGCEFSRRTRRCPRSWSWLSSTGSRLPLLEKGIASGRLPTLTALRDAGEYRRATTTFPSVTPVCLTSIATGAHPDVHHVPHLVWYHRGEQRLVEYGSSFPAMRAAGARRALQDAVFEMTRSHLSRGATTVFEALEDAGLVTAAINFTCYRGRTRHAIRLPEVMRRNRWFEAVDGPTRFFFFNLFESDPTGAPLAIRSRTRGSIDSYAAVVGRWLVTRDGFDFLVFYLPDFDYASHACRARSGARRARARGCSVGGVAPRGRRRRGLSRALRDRRLLRSRPDSGRAWREALGARWRWTETAWSSPRRIAPG